MSPARRRDSFSKEYKLKRSVSTPNVRPQGTNEVDHGAAGIPKEKRRNKLGYHRTPIACGKWKTQRTRRHALSDPAGWAGTGQFFRMWLY